MRLRLHRLEIDGPSWRCGASPTGASSSPGCEGRRRAGRLCPLAARPARDRDPRRPPGVVRRPARGRRAGARQARVPPREQRRPPPFRPARPAAGRLAAALDLRGDLRGSDPAKLAEWRGELYAASITPPGRLAPVGRLPARRRWRRRPAGVAGDRRRPAGRDHRFRAARRPRPAGAELDDIPLAAPAACATATRTA
jgi:hypothetical protein